MIRDLNNINLPGLSFCIFITTDDGQHKRWLVILDPYFPKVCVHCVTVCVNTRYDPQLLSIVEWHAWGKIEFLVTVLIVVLCVLFQYVAMFCCEVVSRIFRIRNSSFNSSPNVKSLINIHSYEG